jgi:Abortive infection alpha
VSEPRKKAVVVPTSRSTLPPLLPDANIINRVPDLARVAAASWWKVTSWSLQTTIAATATVIKRTTSGAAPAVVIAGLASDARGAAWRALGLTDQTDERGVPETIVPAGATTHDLRARGTELLRRSNDVHVVEDTHPAFARILSEITPDEARILRFLYLQGPQPSIDVRTNRPLGIGSELVAGGLNMIGEHAGCRNVEWIHQYLTNLFRLGMVEFSKEQVSNPQRYQLVEAQPKVADALKRAGRWPRTVHRSIHLNAFGEEFCRTCLPLNGMPTNPMPSVAVADAEPGFPLGT